MRAEILLPNFLEIRCVERMHVAARINSNPVTGKERNMPSKSKRNIATAANVSPIQADETAEASVRNDARRTKSDFAHTKSISNAAESRVVKWTIGSKPNANSNAGRFGRRREARKRIRDVY